MTRVTWDNNKALSDILETELKQVLRMKASPVGQLQSWHWSTAAAAAAAAALR